MKACDYRYSLQPLRTIARYFCWNDVFQHILSCLLAIVTIFMFVVVTEIFAVHFVPKGCVTRRPAVLRRGANINKWVEKILHKVNFCLWESAWHQGLKTSLSVYNADRIRPRRPPWPCLTGWPALGVNPGWKIGYLSIAYFYHLVHFFLIWSPAFVMPHIN